MNGRAFIDTARGEFVLGDLALPVADAEPTGALRLLSPAGPVFRPITFGERFRLVERAAVAADPVESLCAAIMKCATVLPGEMELSAAQWNACQTLALMLAGAGIEAPSFAEAMLLVGGRAGWGYREIEEAEASRIDHLARRLEPKLPDPDDGWSRVVFQQEEPSGPDAIRRDLATRLLSRFADPDAGVAEELPEVFGTDRPVIHAMTPERPSRLASAFRPESIPVGNAGFGEVKGDGRPAEPGEYGVREKGGGVAIASPLSPDETRKQEPDSESPGVPPKRRAKVLGYRLEGWEKRSSDAHSIAPSRPAGGENVSAEAQRGTPASRPEPGGAAGHETGSGYGDRIASGEPAPASRGDSESRGNTEQMRSPSVRSLASSIAGRRDGGPGSADTARGTTVVSPSPAAPVTGEAGKSGTMPGHDTIGMAPGMGGGSESAPRSWSLLQEGNEMESGGMASAPPVMAGSLGRPEESGVASIIMELADALAELLHEEADLRGIDR